MSSTEGVGFAAPPLASAEGFLGGAIEVAVPLACGMMFGAGFRSCCVFCCTCAAPGANFIASVPPNAFATPNTPGDDDAVAAGSGLPTEKLMAFVA